MGRDTLEQQELFDTFKSIDTSKASVICIKCNEEKPIESFYTYVAKVQKRTGNPSSYRICKKCMQRLDKVRVELRKITPPPPKDYECPICLITADDYHLRTSTNNKWCLDHSHITGKARGWLCHKCNSAIGWLNDDSSNTRRATEYLERYEDDNS